MKHKSIVRSLESADKTYAAAKELVRKLRSDIAKIDAEEGEILFRLHNRKPGAERTARVAMLLGETDPDDNSAPDGVSARLKAIAGERIDLRTAVDIAQQRLATARHGASKTICEEVRSEYTTRVGRLAKALIETVAANASLVELADELEQADVAWSGTLRPLQATSITGHHGDRIAVWLKDAVSGGFIDKKIIPSELQV